MTQIAIIQGHPDSAGHHLLHALADAYAEGAIAARHEVRRIEVAKIEFPLLRSQVDFETGRFLPLWWDRRMTCAGRRCRPEPPLVTDLLSHSEGGRVP